MHQRPNPQDLSAPQGGERQDSQANPPPAADGPSDIAWLMSEMARAGLTSRAQEKLLRLLLSIADAGGLRKCEVRAAHRIYIAEGLLMRMTPAQARQQLPPLLNVSKRTAERAVCIALDRMAQARHKVNGG